MRHHVCLCPGLGLPASRAVRVKYLLFISPWAMCFVVALDGLKPRHI